MEQYGIDETIDLFEAIKAFKNQLELAKADDGQVTLSDWPLIMGMVGPLQAAIEGGDKIPQELNDLSADEIDTLTEKFGEIIENPAAMQLFQGLSLAADAIADLVKQKQQA